MANTKRESIEFNELTDKLISRRQFIGSGIAIGASAFLIGSTSLSVRAAMSNDSRFGFEAVAANTLDTITVPKGFSWHVVASWGDPLWSRGREFDHDSRGDGASQELAFGDNTDGMSLFQDGDHNVLVVNNEYINTDIFHGNRESKHPENADDIRKSKAGHGVSVFEIDNASGVWQIVKDAKYNRRITADTPIEITGPARGHDLLKTTADSKGVKALGTFNNCGNGRTPWGTYLTCEENFNGYFGSSDAIYTPNDLQKRYGVKAQSRYSWEKYDERFDVAKNPNEPNRHGYIVEIDPFDPTSIPKKRTALGRLKHENAEVLIASNGQVVVYMGDDERGEFIYKFVSDGRYVDGGDNMDLLSSGKLYAARFHENMKGEWLELSPETTGMKSQAEVCINTRTAASIVGATTMDRPEWVAANPLNNEVYCCLTNNKSRGIKSNAGGDAMPVAGPNPRKANQYGQIVRWNPMNADHITNQFSWDLFVVAGNPAVHSDAYAGTSNINKNNMFNSPDGLAFSERGMMWIQTDGNYGNKGDFTGMGNNQMLVGDPVTGEIRRFLVGPISCEVTGICWSADRKTLFVGIQHPGEKGKPSHFPGGGNTVPRSSVVAITRDDGKVIG